MAKEKIFNLFLFEEDVTGYIKQFGVVVHEIDGTDEEKQLFLKKNVSTDYLIPEMYSIPNNYRTIISETSENYYWYDNS